MTSLFDFKQLDALFSVLGYSVGRQLLGSFADAIPGETRALLAVAAEGNLLATERCAHGIKGAAANFGAVELQAASREVELAAQLVAGPAALFPLLTRLEQVARITSLAARRL